MFEKTQLEKDCAQLDMIAAVQYLFACLFGVLALLMLPLFFIGVLAIGIALFGNQPGVSVGDGVVTLMVAIMLLIISGTIAWLFFRTGRCLRSRRSYHFCCIILTLESFVTGIGMVLGIWFAIVMNRSSVKEMFRLQEAADADPNTLAMDQSEFKTQVPAPHAQVEHEPENAQEPQSAEEKPRKRRGRFDNNMTGFREPEKF